MISPNGRQIMISGIISSDQDPSRYLQHVGYWIIPQNWWLSVLIFWSITRRVKQTLPRKETKTTNRDPAAGTCYTLYSLAIPEFDNSSLILWG